MPIKNFNDTIGNRSRDLPVCSAVPQSRRHRVGGSSTVHIYAKTVHKTKQSDEQNGHISSNFCMIYVPSNNGKHPVIKTFTPLHYTSRNFTQLHFTTLSFGLTPFKFPTASFHLASLLLTSHHFTFRRFSPHFYSFHFNPFIIASLSF
jgi:hypothetical protein